MKKWFSVAAIVVLCLAQVIGVACQGEEEMGLKVKSITTIVSERGGRVSWGDNDVKRRIIRSEMTIIVISLRQVSEDNL